LAYSHVTYIGDGLIDTFPITFQYLDPAHIKVYVDAEEVPFTFPTSSQVKLAQAPPSGAIVRIQRETPKERDINYQNASVLDEAVLDRDFDRLNFVVQESFDIAEETLTVDVDNKYDAQGRVIKNVSDPTAPQDVATKKYVDQNTGSTWAEQAAQSAAQAQSAADEAESWAQIALAATYITVDSIADLRALTNKPDGAVVVVIGYYSRGDGGGGVFVKDGDDTVSPDDGGLVIVGTDGSRWKRFF